MGGLINYGQMDEQMMIDGWMKKLWMDEKIVDGQMDEQMNVWMNGRMDEQKMNEKRWIGGLINDGWMKK